jgi:arginine deiminase
LGFCYPEYGRLRTVLMHIPGKELELVGPTTYNKFLFADAIDPAQFRADHQRFVDTLRSEGVDVVLPTELLLDHPLLKSVERSPNLVYVRDTAVVTQAGYLLAEMKSPVRRNETRIIEAGLHKLAVPLLMKTSVPATIEGGDLVFLDDDTLILGVGNRTNQAGLRKLLAIGTQSGLHRLLAVPLPSSVIHLDGTMMVIDRDLAIVHKQSLRNTASLFENGKLKRRLKLVQFLKANGTECVEVTDYERQRRATNVIVIAPRRVIGYTGNARAKRALTENGVDFIEIESAELIRGYGGPRCMTMPILRD